MLFVIFQDDNKDKESNGVCGCSRHYTAKRNDIGELYTIVRARIVGLPLGPCIFRICQNFTSAVCAYYYIDTECYNIEANHDKVQTEPVHSPDLYLPSLRSHWPTQPCASAECQQSIYQNKSADWSRAHLASGIPPENRSRSNRARYRSCVTQK